MVNISKTEQYHIKYAICVSGAAETGHCVSNALAIAEDLGKEIAALNCVLITGATSGIPYWAAKGAKSAGGFVVGVSPAASEKAHLKTYRLPVDYHDIIIYTGFGYSGRNLLLTRIADGIITFCGRMGTLNEFTVAFEDDKPIGIFEGTGGTADMIRDLVSKSHRGPGKIVYNSNPKVLLDELLELIKKEKL